MRAPLLLVSLLAGCGATAGPAPHAAAPVVATASETPSGARVVLAIEDVARTDEAVRWVRQRLLAAGVDPISVVARGGEIVAEVDPALAAAAEAAFPDAPEFVVTEVDEQWSAAEVSVPSFALLDERTSWAGDPQLLRTIVASPQEHDRLAAALDGAAPRASRRVVVGKNLLTRDDPAGAHAVLVIDDAIVTGEDIREVEVVEEAVGLTVVYVTFDDEGAEALRRLTTGRSGFRIALLLDDRVLMAPVITAPILDGRARIDPGDGRPGSAERLAGELRRSASPPPARLRRSEDLLTARAE